MPEWYFTSFSLRGGQCANESCVQNAEITERIPIWGCEKVHRFLLRKTLRHALTSVVSIPMNLRLKH